MCDSKILHLKFIGMDSWDRPVYKDDMGTLWKDVNSRAGTKPDLCTSVNNEFIGEADTGMKYLEKYQGVTVAFEPERRPIWICGLNILQMERDAQTVLALSR